MRLHLAVLLATLGGFIALSYEILWVRVYSFLSWGRAYAFGLLLGSYLAGLAFGSLLARRYCRKTERAALVPLALFVLAANILGFLVVPAAAEAVRHVSHFWVLPGVAAVAGLLGTVLPLVAHFGIDADERVGARLSYLYLGNILGSAAGSLLTGFVLMDVWSLEGISLFLALLGMAMAGGVLLLASVRRSFALLAAGGAAVALLAPPLFDGAYEKMQLKADYEPGFRFRTVIENRSGVITVTPDGTVHGDGVYDGRFNTGLVEDVNGIFRMYAVGAFRAPRDVLVVGLGTGSWCQVIAHHPAVERVTVVEINPGYIDLLETAPEVSSLLGNPKVTFVVDDGRRWLVRSKRRFDLIVQNTTYHFRAHATNLLSREYFGICRRHLREGGLLVYNTTWSLDAQRTGLETFRHAWLVHNCMFVSDAPLVPDLAGWRRLLRDYRIDGKPVLDGPTLERLLRDDPWVNRATLEERTRDARVITDDNMASEWR